jgi:hypothetical protein
MDGLANFAANFIFTEIAKFGIVSRKGAKAQKKSSLRWLYSFAR